MPRLPEAKKDVTSCDKPRRGANTRRAADFRMGQPAGSDSGIRANARRRTRGTETSQYPEEKKTTVIAQVVASERAGAQTGVVTAAAGVVGPPSKAHRQARGTQWKLWPQRVKAPYPKAMQTAEAAPE